MRCLSCNCILTDAEATNKYEDSDEYIDLCSSCLSKVEFDFIYDYTVNNGEVSNQETDELDEVIIWDEDGGID